jgi:hypothetical protein
MSVKLGSVAQRPSAESVSRPEPLSVEESLARNNS